MLGSFGTPQWCINGLFSCNIFKAILRSAILNIMDYKTRSIFQHAAVFIKHKYIVMCDACTQCPSTNFPFLKKVIYIYIENNGTAYN